MFLFGSKLAGIQYWGKEGITQECLDAIIRLIQYDDRIDNVRILTSKEKYCLLVTIDNSGDLIAIKSGFSTGYKGEGPRKFSYALALLNAHGIKIDEYEVKDSLLNRLDASALTKKDIKEIQSLRPIRPQRFYHYIQEEHFDSMKDENFWKAFRPVVPFAIIDNRIMDLAISFWEKPEENLMKGYKRIEDIFRKRTGSEYGFGSDLFMKSFVGQSQKLKWEGFSENEHTARAGLFKDAYSSSRNRMMHRELDSDRHEYLSEFLLLNHLYRLEKEAVDIKV
jgi:hypothetical protein